MSEHADARRHALRLCSSQRARPIRLRLGPWLRSRDNSGAYVANAKVTLINVATNVTQTAQTDKDGKYEFDSVPIGNYQVSTEATGFEGARTEPFNVSTDARQRVDIGIKPGRVNETVEVTSAAELLDTETSSRSQVIGTREVENLPLNGRSYADLVLLAPGTRSRCWKTSPPPAAKAHSTSMASAPPSMSSSLTALRTATTGTSNQGFEDENISPSPDAVSEFRLETNNYSAEYGRQPGAVVNVSTRSGENQFHGRAWDYLRNTNLNAVGPIEPITNTKPKLIRNQFGGTFGGPIFKDRTFFFTDYEGLRQIFNYQLAPRNPTQRRAASRPLPPPSRRRNHSTHPRCITPSPARLTLAAMSPLVLRPLHSPY